MLFKNWYGSKYPLTLTLSREGRGDRKTISKS